MRQIGPLRGLAILAVITSHTPVYGMLALTWWGARFGATVPPPDWTWVGTPVWFGLETLNQIGRFAVPLFFFANGLFLEYATQGDPRRIGWKLAGDWIRLILPPLCIWLSISIGLYLLEVVFTRNPSGIELFRIGWRFGERWYIFMLIELFAISPLIVRLAARHPLRLLVAWITVDVSLRLVAQRGLLGIAAPQFVDDLEIVFGWVNLWGFGSFVILGMVFGRYYSKLRLRLVAFRWPLTLAALVLCVLSVAEAIFLILRSRDYASWAADRFSTYPYALVAVLALLAWDIHRAPVAKLLTLIGSQSYGIYVMHTVVLEYASKLAYHLTPALLGQQVVFQVLLMGLGLAVPLLLMAAVGRSKVARYHRALFGAPPMRLGDSQRQRLRGVSAGPVGAQRKAGHYMAKTNLEIGSGSGR